MRKKLRFFVIFLFIRNIFIQKHLLLNIIYFIISHCLFFVNMHVCDFFQQTLMLVYN